MFFLKPIFTLFWNQCFLSPFFAIHLTSSAFFHIRKFQFLPLLPRIDNSKMFFSFRDAQIILHSSRVLNNSESTENIFEITNLKTKNQILPTFIIHQPLLLIQCVENIFFK